MWTINVRLGWVEWFTLFSVLAVTVLVGAAFRAGWFIALVPGLTYLLAIGAAYLLYVSDRDKGGEASAVAAAFRVVDSRGVCPLGRRSGELVRVDPAGSVVPQLCPPAEAVLRQAVITGQEQEVKRWCCPIFDHLLVFEREHSAA